jgi:hypothetical protein
LGKSKRGKRGTYPNKSRMRNTNDNRPLGEIRGNSHSKVLIRQATQLVVFGLERTVVEHCAEGRFGREAAAVVAGIDADCNGDFAGAGEGVLRCISKWLGGRIERMPWSMYRTGDLDYGFAAGCERGAFGEVDKDVLGERSGCEGGEDCKGLHFESVDE